MTSQVGDFVGENCVLVHEVSDRFLHLAFVSIQLTIDNIGQSERHV